MLDTVRKVTGAGHVYEISKRQPHWRSAWIYSSSGNTAVCGTFFFYNIALTTERRYYGRMSWEYIAGFIDGEGSIVERNQGYNILISQANFEVLDKIRKFVGHGYVYALTKRRRHWKDAWVYSSGGSKETFRLLTKIADKLVVKRVLARKVLIRLESRLKEIENERHLRRERLRLGKKLRERGLTYREIGKELNADFGYIRRLILGKLG